MGCATQVTPSAETADRFGAPKPPTAQNRVPSVATAPQGCVPDGSSLAFSQAEHVAVAAASSSRIVAVPKPGARIPAARCVRQHQRNVLFISAIVSPWIGTATVAVAGPDWSSSAPETAE